MLSRQPLNSRLDSTPHLLLNSSRSSSPLSSLECLTITGLDRTYHAHHFIFSFTFFYFLFIPCGRLRWLPVSFLLHAKYTLLYCIALYYKTTEQNRIVCTSKSEAKVTNNKTSASVELTQTRHSHSKQLFQGGQISVFLQGGSKSFIRCL